MNRLIITTSIGPYERIGEITAPHMRRYANSIDADFINITQNPDSWGANFVYWKTMDWAYQQGYDQILYLDCDVLVNPNLALNIFNIPIKKIGMRQGQIVDNKFDYVHNFDPGFKSEDMFNSGVVLIDAEFIPELLPLLYEESNPNELRPKNLGDNPWHMILDQVILCSVLRKMGIKPTNLGESWNMFYNINQANQLKLHRTNMLHFLGPKEDNRHRRASRKAKAITKFIESNLYKEWT